MTMWWVWIALAVVFGALEVTLPVFAFLGFAAGAGLTGLLLLIGMGAGPAARSWCSRRCRGRPSRRSGR